MRKIGQTGGKGGNENAITLGAGFDRRDTTSPGEHLAKPAARRRLQRHNCLVAAAFAAQPPPPPPSLGEAERKHNDPD